MIKKLNKKGISQYVIIGAVAALIFIAIFVGVFLIKTNTSVKNDNQEIKIKKMVVNSTGWCNGNVNRTSPNDCQKKLSEDCNSQLTKAVKMYGSNEIYCAQDPCRLMGATNYTQCPNFRDGCSYINTQCWLFTK